MSAPEHHLEAAVERLRRSLSPRTFLHSEAVRDEAVRLAGAFEAEPAAARWAGLLHDCAKDLSAEQCLVEARALGLEVFPAEEASPPVLHQRIGAEWAVARFGVADQTVLEAIRCHTTGAGEMDAVARCLFVADWISPDRTYEGVGPLRAAMARGPEEGFGAVMRLKREVVALRGLPDHPWSLAAYARWLPPRP